MSTLEFLTGKDYLSHSSMTSWLDCGERFFLERIARVPQQMSWWLVGGSAFHTATEWLDTGRETDLNNAWSFAWQQQWDKDITANGIDPADVRAGGRASKDWPNKENADWWQANGPVMVAAYVQWRDERFEEGWQWLPMPDGSPAIEVPINIVLGDVLVKGYIDRGMIDPDGQPRVVDLKTGGHAPASSLQLGIYALGLERAIGVKPLLGNYYMARKSELTDDKSLLHYTPDLVGKWFGQAKAGIEAEIFLPHVTSMCGTCSVRPYCSAFGAQVALPGSVTTIATSS